MLTFAGYQLRILGDLPDDTRRSLLHHLDAQCSAAATRNQTILRDRRRRAHEAFLDAVHIDPPRVIAVRSRILLDADDATRGTITRAVKADHTTTRRTR